MCTNLLKIVTNSFGKNFEQLIDCFDVQTSFFLARWVFLTKVQFLGFCTLFFGLFLSYFNRSLVN